MIVDRPESFYIFIYHPSVVYSDASYFIYKGNRLTNKEYLEHWGKWIIVDEKERLDELAEKLDPYVENKAIPCVKYDRYPLGMFDLGGCVMCIFCDDRERDEIWEILAGFGATLKAWVHDRDVVQMWMPGGLILEKWIEEHHLDEKKAQEIRDDAQMKFDKQFGNEDAFASGWDQ